METKNRNRQILVNFHSIESKQGRVLIKIAHVIHIDHLIVRFYPSTILKLALVFKNSAGSNMVQILQYNNFLRLYSLNGNTD